MDAVTQEVGETAYALDIITLGRFEIRWHNNAIDFLSGRSTKLWDLFKYLLAHKGKGVPPEIILEDLYPGEVYENPKNTLQNNVYRLRKLLNDEKAFNSCNILFVNGCYQLDISDDIRLDTDAFEENIQSAELLKNENPEQSVTYYEQAIALYDGDYLPEVVYGDWIIPKRNYYRRIYVQSVMQLTRLYKQNHAYDDVFRICEKALQIEPYDEELNISFMESLAGSGRISEARKHYSYITGTLYRQFGIKPTAEMLKVYQLLKENNASQKASQRIEDFLKDENQKGAFYCDTKVFRSVFILEKRRSERTGEAVFIVSVTFGGPQKTDAANGGSSLFQQFRRFLIFSLRKGDIVTTWNDSQLVFMLPKIDFKHVRTVTDSIIKMFMASMHLKDLDIKVDVHPFLP